MLLKQAIVTQVLEGVAQGDHGWVFGGVRPDFAVWPVA